ncbi:MAG: hypothetical protein GX415_03610 [Chloroflexi bacterium]|jgi:hypothetical protein|nr:hypothetical protein [Anaerolineaceae bacterium]NLI44487.1 hypothetical protein [Chloroflexota bacterium]HOE34864.1 hypothetical protein [Anaerolineaceae bacterium]HOT25986.1 hypothetical protein [Anaerolineaceae bacterium]HQK04030.1 hypothetical protein [Anaerolineaceae bacterium]
MDTLKSNPHAFCIKADVIGSRDSRLARFLPEIARALNERFAEALLTPFIVRAGDEIFGILENPQAGFLAYKALYAQSRERNVPFYVGMGVGAVDLDESADSELVNGKAIWLAAGALEALKGKPTTEILARQKHSRFRYAIAVSEQPEENRVFEHFLFYIMSHITSRTALQHQAAALKEAHPDWDNLRLYHSLEGKQAEIIDPQNAIANFSKLLRRGNYQLVRDAEETFLYLLRSRFPED